MNPTNYFSSPKNSLHVNYEALREFYIENKTASEVATKFGLGLAYFKKIKYNFQQQLKNHQDPFFSQAKRGPKKKNTSKNTIDIVIELRKKNYSVLDIRSILESKNIKISLITIDRILKDAGFAPLLRRTKNERRETELPKQIEAPSSAGYILSNERFSSERSVGILVFLPILEQMKIIDAIKRANFPQTSILSDVSMVLSFLAIKLLGRERLSHDDCWKFDRVLGFFAGLNVLPKSATLSSYSYRITRSMNKKLLTEMANIFSAEGDFNLDFKTIPHWGDDSVLEKNFSGTRNKAIKSILSLIVQNPTTGYLNYSEAGVLHEDQNDSVIDFVDFWTKSTGKCPKMLIFDSKFTCYENLSKLNMSKEGIKFLTIRRKGAKLLARVKAIPEDEWTKIKVDGKNRKHKSLIIYDEKCQLRKYKGEVRQILIKGTGRENPIFLITNDFDSKANELVKKYARRWLVENEIAEQVEFFQINHPSSSIVIKVDFDLTISLLAHNLYKILSQQIEGFEDCTVPTINRKFIDNGGSLTVDEKHRKLTVELKKKTHLPLLLSLDLLKSNTQLTWHGLEIEFKSGTVS